MAAHPSVLYSSNFTRFFVSSHLYSMIRGGRGCVRRYYILMTLCSLELSSKQTCSFAFENLALSKTPHPHLHKHIRVKTQIFPRKIYCLKYQKKTRVTAHQHEFYMYFHIAFSKSYALQKQHKKVDRKRIVWLNVP